MTAEGIPKTPEGQEFSDPNVFVGVLFDRSIAQALEIEGAQIYKEVKNVEHTNWDTESGREITVVSTIMEVERGVLIMDDKCISGLVLGKERTRSVPEGRRVFQWGFIGTAGFKRYEERHGEKDPVNILKGIVTHGVGEWKEGEVEVDRYGMVRVNAFADEFGHGGNKITGLGRDQDKIMSEKGMEACLDVVERTRLQRTR